MQVLQLSGIVALFFSGVFHAHYSYYSVAPDAQITLRRFFQFAAFLSETFVFAYLGLQVLTLLAFPSCNRLLTALWPSHAVICHVKRIVAFLIGVSHLKL